MIHKNFSSVDKLRIFEIKNFIFNYVGYYDSNLASYLKTNLELVEDIEKSIDRVIKNRDNFLRRTLDRKDDIFVQEVFYLIDKYKTRYTYREICNYIDNINLNLPVKLNIYEDDDEIDIIDMKNITLNDYRCIKEIIELAKSLYLSPIIDSSIDACASYENVKGINNGSESRILKFIPRRT